MPLGHSSGPLFFPKQWEFGYTLVELIIVLALASLWVGWIGTWAITPFRSLETCYSAEETLHFLEGARAKAMAKGEDSTISVMPHQLQLTQGNSIKNLTFSNTVILSSTRSVVGFKPNGNQKWAGTVTIEGHGQIKTCSIGIGFRRLGFDG